MSLYSENILFYFPTPFNALRGGGVEHVTDKVVRELQKYGYNIFYLHLKNEDIFNNGFEYPAPIFFLPNSKSEDLPVNRLYYQNLIEEKQVNLVINQEGLFNSTYFLNNTGKSNVKIISVIHSNPMLNYDYLWHDLLYLRNGTWVEKLKRIARLMLYYKIKKETWNSLSERFRFMLEHQRKICVLSESYINTLKRIDSRLPANTVAIPNPNTFPDVKSIPQKEKILLFVGRLDNRSKKLFILIDIWRKIARRFADWKLIIVGSGRDEQNLYKYAKDVERIEFVNYCKPEPYYKQASIFCMTSLFEGFPMCLTEAMQYGCVPIAFNSFAAVNDIIKSGRNGELVTPFKTQEYIKKLSYLMENSNYRNTLSYNAFQYIKRYDVSAIIPQWIEMIES